MGTLNVENKLQLTKKTTKNKKIEKSLKLYNIIHLKTIRYKRTALGNTNSFDPQLQASETGQHFTAT